MSDNLDRVLRERFGFDTFRAGQREAIETLLERGRLVCIQPTGHGKSLLYQLPAVLQEGMTLVISPLLALMRDQIRQLQERFNVPAGAINSDQTDEENEHVMREAKRGRLRILFVAPERLDNLEGHAFVVSLPVDLLVVDEAHCISTWGHDFRPAYRQIVRVAHELEQRRPELRVLGLTATADERTEADILSQFRSLGGQLPEIHREPMDRPNLELSVIPTRGLGAKLAILARLVPELEGTGILYCATRDQTEIVARYLASVGVDIAAYHAGLPPDEKRARQATFFRGECRIVAATNALGMGIDKPDIRFIVHVDLPGSITSYYQEVGRAGRDGKPARGILIHDRRDRDVHDYFIKSAQPGREDFEKIQGIVGAAEGTGPIRREIGVRSGLHPTKVTVILAELQEQGFVEKRLEGRRQVYVSLGREGAPDLSRYERQKEVRTKELEAMLRYGACETGCLMQTLRIALGDGAATSCGRCSHCRPESVGFRFPTDTEIAAARRWIEDRELVIPAARVPKMAAGLALLDGEIRSPAFVDFMRGRADPDRADLPDPLGRLLGRWLETLAARHELRAIVPMPSRTWQQRDSVARSIAERLGVPVVDALRWDQVPEARQGELLNNDQRRSNVHGRMTAAVAGIQDRPVLLLDDYVGSGATLKEAGRALRKDAGFTGDIIPLTIARVRWRLGASGMI